MSSQLPRSIQCGVPRLKTDRHLKVVAADGRDILPRLSTTVHPQCNGPRLKRLAQSRCSTCPVVPIDTLPRSLETATTYPSRGGLQVTSLSVVPCLTATSISSASVGRVTFESGVCPDEILHPSGARLHEKEAVETAEQRISALPYVAGAELSEREVVDMMATLLCSFDGMDSKIDNGDCFGPETVSSPKKNHKPNPLKSIIRVLPAAPKPDCRCLARC